MSETRNELKVILTANSVPVAEANLSQMVHTLGFTAAPSALAIPVYMAEDGLPEASSQYEGQLALLRYDNAIPNHYELHVCVNDGNGSYLWAPLNYFEASEGHG